VFTHVSSSPTRERVSKSLSEKGWSWGDGPGAGVPASAGVWPEPAEAGTPERRYRDETCNVHNVW